MSMRKLALTGLATVLLSSGIIGRVPVSAENSKVKVTTQAKKGFSVGDYIRIFKPKFYEDYSHGIHVNLEYKGITSLEGLDQIKNPEQVVSINLGSNLLTTIPADVFSRFPNLDIIDLRNNQLTCIHPKAFSGLPKLRVIVLGHNQIEQLTREIFSNLLNLQFLELSYNQLRYLPLGIFSKLSKLDQLDMDNNQLSQLTEGIFSDLTNLSQLTLSINKLNHLPIGVFSRLNKLTFLNLAFNPIPITSTEFKKIYLPSIDHVEVWISQ
jgi:Leucine-rich repeat (LRR) protein